MPVAANSSNATIVIMSSSPPSYVSSWAALLSPSSLSSSPSSSSPLLRLAALLLVASLTTAAVRRWLAARSVLATLRAVRRGKEAQLKVQLAAVQSADGRELTLLSDTERRILALSATQLLDKLRARELTAREVLLAFIRQTLRLHNKCNVLSEPNFVSALQHATRLDESRSQQAAAADTALPLHGLPISLKDGVGVAGLDCTLGLARYASQPWTADCLLVRILRAKGAQLYVKSNVPQTLISFECCNPLFGVTTHLQSARHTCGGSSGGEAVLLAGGGSVLGIGTDIGGSVRIPAHFSGCYALKCTSRRLSVQGFRSAVPGQEAIPGVAGPMAMRVDDLVLLLRELLVEEAWKSDSELVPLPLDEAAVNQTGKLRVGYYTDDGFIPPSPACARAVTETVAALEAAGHTVVRFVPPRMADCIALYYSLISADGAHTMTDQLKGEQWEGYVRSLVTAVRMPGVVKDVVAALLRALARDPLAAQILSAARQRSVSDTWRLQAQRKAYKAEFFAAFEQQQLDAIVCPAHVLPAVRHGQYQAVTFTCSFTLAYNVLDAPAGVCPVTTVRETDVYSVQHPPARSLLEKAARKFYNPKESAGLPVGVQVAAAPYRDEMVLRTMKEIEKLIPWQRPSVEF